MIRPLTVMSETLLSDCFVEIRSLKTEKYTMFSLNVPNEARTHTGHHLSWRLSNSGVAKELGQSNTGKILEKDL